MVESFADQLDMEQISKKQQDEQKSCIWQNISISAQDNKDCKVLKPGEQVEPVLNGKSNNNDKTKTKNKKQVLDIDDGAFPMGIEQHKVALVIDANVLIKQISLRELMGAKDDKEFSENYEVYTLDEVIDEIKDQGARNFITGGTLPFDLQIKSGQNTIDKKEQDYTDYFARDTGDFVTLSTVDKQLIAFAVHLTKEKGEYYKLKREPEKLEEFRPKQFKKDYEKNDQTQQDDQSQDSENNNSDSNSNSNSDDQNDNEDDGWNEVAKVKTSKRKHKRHQEQEIQKKQEEAENFQQEGDKANDVMVSTKQQEEEEQNEDDLDNEEDGGQWVTQDNLYDHINKNTNTQDLIAKSEQEQAQQEEDDLLKPRFVKFLTSDYAMQNVLIQMGFTLLSLDGKRITRVKRFKLLCKGCKTINMDITRHFCEACGGHTLVKVSVYMDHQGKITYFENPRRKVNNRGQIYSIPKPKHGRNNQDMVLREDELMMGERAIKMKQVAKKERVEQKTITNTLQGNYWHGGTGYSAPVSDLLYDDGAKGGKQRKQLDTNIQYGHGKKNPNIARKKV